MTACPPPCGLHDRAGAGAGLDRSDRRNTLMTECSCPVPSLFGSRPDRASAWPSGENPKPPKTRPLLLRDATRAPSVVLKTRPLLVRISCPSGEKAGARGTEGDGISRITVPSGMRMIRRPLSYAVATRSGVAGSGENANGPYCVLSKRGAQSATRQILSPPANVTPVVATPSIWPFGEKATPQPLRHPGVPANAAESVWITLASATRQTLTVLSFPAEASVAPSGEKASDRMAAGLP